MMHNELQIRLNMERQRTLITEAERERLIQTLNQSKRQQKHESDRG
jgi:hypothetical protein